MKKDKIIGIVFLFIISFFSFKTLIESREFILKEIKKFDVRLGLVSEEGIYKKNESLKKTISQIESEFNNYIYNKNMFVELNGYIHKVLRKNVVNDIESDRTIIKDKKGYLHFNYGKERINMDKNFNGIKNISEFCQREGKEFLYVQAPLKIIENKTILPIGIKDYSNKMADELVKKLKGDEVPVLDLRESMERENLNYNEVFFKTDHHWTLESGYWAYQKVIERLRGCLDIENKFKYDDEKNYEMLKFEKHFVGSQGKRVGKYYTEIDDVVLPVPKFVTDLTVKFFNAKGEFIKERTGEFYDALINREILESKNVYDSKYEGFLDTNQEIRIVNNFAKNNKKILFIKDSFARPVAGYMSLEVKETRLLDARHFKGDFYNYIKKYNPDAVIMLYNPGVFKIAEMFEFY